MFALIKQAGATFFAIQYKLNDSSKYKKATTESIHQTMKIPSTMSGWEEQFAFISPPGIKIVHLARKTVSISAGRGALLQHGSKLWAFRHLAAWAKAAYGVDCRDWGWAVS